MGMYAKASNCDAAQLDPDDLPDDVRFLKDLIRELMATVQQQRQDAEQVRQRLDRLLRRLYGPRAERWDPNQPALFPEQLDADAAADADDAADAAEAAAGTRERRKKKPGHGRQTLPEHLPRERCEHPLSAAELLCPCCGQERRKIGEESTPQLDYEPASLKVIDHVRFKYACPDCDLPPVLAAKPQQPIPRGLPGPGLLACVIVDKYADHLPLNRQEGRWARHGVILSRSTLCDWMAAAAERLRPLYELMKRAVLQSAVIHTDGTPVDVVQAGVPGKRQGHIWPYIGDYRYPYRVFDFTPTAAQTGPNAFLADYAGYVQADAGSAFEGLFQPGSPRTEVGCWAHARRYFYDARTHDAARAHVVLAWVRQLYQLEAQVQEMTVEQRLALLAAPPPAERAEDPILCSSAFGQQRQALIDLSTQLAQAREALAADRKDPPLSPAQRWELVDRHSQLSEALAMQALIMARLKLRREAAVPIMEHLLAYVDQQQGQVLPTSLIAAGFTYVDNHRIALQRYLSDGRLDIDNNVSERTLRCITIGRNNWLFYGSEAGGRTAAVLVTLIATCKHLGIEPFHYLRDLFTRLPGLPPDRLEEWLPDRWAKAQRRAAFLASQKSAATNRAASGPDPPGSSWPGNLDPPAPSRSAPTEVANQTSAPA
jgi:transposase